MNLHADTIDDAAEHTGEETHAVAVSGKESEATSGGVAEGWTFLTNHSHVLICLTRDPTMRLRDVADEVGITERAVQGIVNDLEAAGCIEKFREGRRNRYEIDRGRPMRHRVERGHVVGELLDVLAPVVPS
jgi:predicted transcriptional regulator